MLATVAHLGELHANYNFGVNETATLWMTIVSVLMYAGPAIVAVVYLMIRDRESVGSAVGLAPWSSAVLPKAKPRVLQERAGEHNEENDKKAA